jgi:hypothetical protein
MNLVFGGKKLNMIVMVSLEKLHYLTKKNRTLKRLILALSFSIKITIKKMKKEIHAGRILTLFLAALIANNTYPLVAGFLAVAWLIITFINVDKVAKEEQKNLNK